MQYDKEVIIFRTTIASSLIGIINDVLKKSSDNDTQKIKSMIDERIILPTRSIVKEKEIFNQDDIYFILGREEEEDDDFYRAQLKDWDKEDFVEECLDFIDVLINNRDEFVYDDDLFRIIDLISYVIQDGSELKEVIDKWLEI